MPCESHTDQSQGTVGSRNQSDEPDTWTEPHQTRIWGERKHVALSGRTDKRS
jgi:hypothetical protein